MSKLIQTIKYYLTTSKQERKREIINNQIKREKAYQAFKNDLDSPAQYMG